MGRGVGLDGIPAEVFKMIPPNFMNFISTLFQLIFQSKYLKHWGKQILNAVPKSGHSSKEPKLRGVAIAPLLARLYDIVLNQ